MIVAGLIIAAIGLWIISQSTADGKLGPSALTIGVVLVLVGLFK